MMNFKVMDLVEVDGRKEVFEVIKVEGETLILRCLDGIIELDKRGNLKELHSIIKGVIIPNNQYRVNKNCVYRVDEEDSIDEIIEVLGNIPHLEKYINRLEGELDRLRYDNENLLDEIEEMREY